MKSQNREDAILRALAILPKGDAAASDPRFLKNPELIAEARTTRETAVDVWLAVSPLQMAPPKVLDRIMTEVRPQAKTVAPTAVSFWPKALAIGGWAAAAVLALLLLQKHSPAVDAPINGPQLVAQPAGNLPPPTPVVTAPKTATPAERKQQEEVARLKRTLEEQERQGILPRVRGLSAPGMASVSPEKARDDLRRMLVDALRSSLEAETGAPGDSAAMVIERGWLPAGFPALEDGQTVRHRHFPEDDWQDYGLTKAGDDTYYDPGNNLIWSRDPENRGFIGRKPVDSDNIGEITKNQDNPAKTSSSPTPKASPQNNIQTDKLAAKAPSGIIIDDPITSSSTAVIEGVSPALANTTQWILASNSTGAFSVAVDSSMFTSSGTLMVPLTTTFGTLSNSSVTGQAYSFSTAYPILDSSSALVPQNASWASWTTTTFELQTRDANGNVTGTILKSNP